MAARESIDIVVLKKNLTLLAKLDITMDGENILIRAKNKLTLAGSSSSLVLDGNITGRTLGKWVEHAAAHDMTGPATMNFQQALPAADYKGCNPSVRAAASAQSATIALD